MLQIRPLLHKIRKFNYTWVQVRLDVFAPGFNLNRNVSLKVSCNFSVGSRNCQYTNACLDTETDKLVKEWLTNTDEAVENWAFIKYINNEESSCACSNNRFQLAGDWTFGGTSLLFYVTRIHWLDTIRDQGVEARQLVIGVSSYGRSFRMKDASCSGPFCTFNWR